VDRRTGLVAAGVLILALAIVANPPVSSMTHAARLRPLGEQPKVLDEMGGSRRAGFNPKEGGGALSSPKARLWAEDYTPGNSVDKPLQWQGGFISAGAKTGVHQNAGANSTALLAKTSER
jgi:hypothetical protein